MRFFNLLDLKLVILFQLLNLFVKTINIAKLVTAQNLQLPDLLVQVHNLFIQLLYFIFEVRFLKMGQINFILLCDSAEASFSCEDTPSSPACLTPRLNLTPLNLTPLNLTSLNLTPHTLFWGAADIGRHRFCSERCQEQIL